MSRLCTGVRPGTGGPKVLGRAMEELCEEGRRASRVSRDYQDRLSSKRLLELWIESGFDAAKFRALCEAVVAVPAGPAPKSG